MRRTLIPHLRGSIASWVGGVVIAACICPAFAITYTHVSMKDIVAKSDQIFVAVCESKRTEFRRGNVMTIYKMRPLEFWKGGLTIDKDGVFEMEEVGGSLNGPIPLFQQISGRIPMIPGEEVLLFTRQKKISAEAKALAGGAELYRPGNPFIIHPVKGRYTILTDPDTQERVIVSPAAMMAVKVANDGAVRKYLNQRQKTLTRRRKAAGARAKTTTSDSLAIRDMDKLDDVRAKIKDQIEAAGTKP